MCKILHIWSEGLGVSLRGSGVSLSGTESTLREMSFLMSGTMGHGGGCMQIPTPPTP